MSGASCKLSLLHISGTRTSAKNLTVHEDLLSKHKTLSRAPVEPKQFTVSFLKKGLHGKVRTKINGQNSPTASTPTARTNPTTEASLPPAQQAIHAVSNGLKEH